MSKHPEFANVVAYAELVIRPSDSRPIILSLFETDEGSWDTAVSLGTAADMQEAISVLESLMAIAVALANVRRSASYLHDKLSGIENGDIPF